MILATGSKIRGQGTGDRKSCTLHSVFRARKQAFTLVEVMLSVSILAIGLVAVLGCYASLVNGLEIAEDSIDAFYLLNGKLAEIEQDNLKVLSSPPDSSQGGFNGQDEDFVWASEVKILDRSELGISQVFEEDQAEPKDYLSQVKLRVFNQKSEPMREVVIYSYFDGYDITK